MTDSVTISAPYYDLDGSVELRHEIDHRSSKLQDYSRRVSRTATTDGGAFINDMGFSHGDRTVEISLVNLSKSKADTLRHLIQSYAEVNISLPDGVYRAAISKFYDRPDKTTLTILLIEAI